MAGSTPNLGLYLPGGGSTGTIVPDETADIDPLNENFRKIDTAIGDVAEQNRQWYGPAASIGSIPVGPKDGDTYQESDGNKVLWKRMGGLWVTNEGGAYLIRPTSVAGTGITINADGSIDLGSTGNACRVNGVFSSRFRRYRIIADWNVSGGSNGLQVQLCSGGTNDSSSNYNEQHLLGTGSSANSSQSLGGSAFSGVGVASTGFTYDALVFNPAHASKTTQLLVHWGALGSSVYGVGMISQQFGINKDFDGFRFALSIASGRTFNSGEIRVLGYA